MTTHTLLIIIISTVSIIIGTTIYVTVLIEKSWKENRTSKKERDCHYGIVIPCLLAIIITIPTYAFFYKNKTVVIASFIICLALLITSIVFICLYNKQKRKEKERPTKEKKDNNSTVDHA